MSITSDWPLPPKGIRFLTPKHMVNQLSRHKLSEGLYPIAIGYYPVAFRHHMQRQEHDNYLLIYCTSGQGTLYIDNRSYSIRAGDLMLLPKQTSHHYKANDQKPWTIYWVHFDGLLAEAFCEQLNLTQLCQNIGLQPRVISSFDRLSDLRNNSYQITYFIHASHQLQSLLSYLALLVKQNQPQSSSAIDLVHIESFMQQHLHDHLTLDELAAEVRLSKYHFSKKFKQLMGQAPIQYFIHLKMQHASYLLDSSNRSIKQISAELGYEDAYYFSRLFKQVTGLSPDQYRKSKYR